MHKILMGALLVMMAVGAAVPAQAHEEGGHHRGWHMRVDEGYGRAQRVDWWRAEEMRRREMWRREHRGYGYLPGGYYAPQVYVAPRHCHWR